MRDLRADDELITAELRMPEAEAQQTLDAMAAGLSQDAPGIRELLDRVTAHAAAPLLLDALVEAGARSLLDGADMRLAAAIDGWRLDRQERAC